MHAAAPQPPWLRPPCLPPTALPTPAPPPQRGGGTVDETIMLRHALERLPIFIQDSATSSGEAREYLRDNPDTRLALLDDGLQHLPLVKCVGAGGVGGGGRVHAGAVC